MTEKGRQKCPVKFRKVDIACWVSYNRPLRRGLFYLKLVPLPLSGLSGQQRRQGVLLLGMRISWEVTHFLYRHLAKGSFSCRLSPHTLHVNTLYLHSWGNNSREQRAPHLVFLNSLASNLPLDPIFTRTHFSLAFCPALEPSDSQRREIQTAPVNSLHIRLSETRGEHPNS